MFESGQFYVVDPETGISSIDSKADVQVFYNTVLVFAGFTLFGSLVYYGVVFLAEVLGSLPKCFAKCFADKRRRKLSSFGMDASMKFEDNPFAGGNIAEIKQSQENEAKTLEDIEAMRNQKAEHLAMIQALADQNKTLKRDQMAGNNGTTPRGDKKARKKKKKKEEGRAFAPKRVTSNQN